ncbi:MAG: AAA family ATPase [Chryseobacterium jejuense]|uniref:AAA family ATPase n=1 Tax=Chryseobacterium jejuense TaxID=445960 RepID=UPI003D0E3A2F
MEFTLPYPIKKRLFSELIKFDNPFGLNDIVSKIEFLKGFTKLKDLRLSDYFDNAYEELYNYIITKDESKWFEQEEILNKFNLISDDDFFKKIVERIVNTGSDAKKNSCMAITNRFISPFDYYLMSTYENGVLYYVIAVNQKDIINVSKNEIIFNVIDRNDSIKGKFKNNFILWTNDWDDYGYETTFLLKYKNELEDIIDIGRIKILKMGETITSLSITKSFTELSNDYCSLFIEDESYFTLKELFEDEYISILYALNDVAYFSKIYERFEFETGFIKSIFRDEKETEKRVRTIKLKLKYGDISEFFKFHYKYKPVYSNSDVELDFNFNSAKTIPKRLFCLIGKNGVGKSLFIKDLLLNFSEKNSEKIKPQIPIYGKVIFVSFSYLDFFYEIKNTEDFNFIYSGIINTKENRPYNNNEIEINLLTLFEKLIVKKDIKKYYVIISKFIDYELLRILFDVKSWWENIPEVEDLKTSDIIDIEILTDNLSDFLKKLSSGQKVLFFIITELIVNIRYNSLLIFDEPETHLHPNAITEFMGVIMQLLEEYDSYGIIATHSPLVVREVFSDSIYVFEKEENTPRIRRLEFETFGENLSIITDEIFGNRDVSKYYIKTIENLVNEGKSYEDIETLIEGEVPLNLNVKILIKSLVRNRNEES